MPFIPGKLKPRIKPRLGARVPGIVGNGDQLKNKQDDQNTSAEVLVPKDAAEDVSPPSCAEPSGSPSVVATNPPQEHRSQKPASDEFNSVIYPSNPNINNNQEPRGFEGAEKNSQPASPLAMSDVEKSLSGCHVNLAHKEASEDDVLPHTSLIAENSSSKADSPQLPPPFSSGQNEDSTNDESVPEQPSEGAIVEGNVISADKYSGQFTAVHPSALETRESLESSSVKVAVQKNNLKNIRLIGSKFHKPNLKRLARPLTASSGSPSTGEPVRSSDATPESSLTGSACRKTSDVQAAVPGDNAEPSIEASISSRVAGSETSEEYPACSSGISVTSDVAREKLISVEKTWAISEIPFNIAVEPVSDSSQVTDSVQQPESISGADNSNSTTNAVDQVVFKKPPKMFMRAPVLRSDRIRPKVETLKTKTGESESAKINGFVATSVKNTNAENVTDEAVPIIDTTIDRNSITCSPLSAVNVNKKNSSSTDSEMKDVAVSDSRVSVKPAIPKTDPPLKTGKSNKGETEDVRVLLAISAVDYLKRHDHALGDSILRRIIIGDKNMESRSRKSTMCSTCNPQTLKKCLSSLWSFDKFELQTIIKKAAERQKTPVTYASLPGKTLFKPSLGRQRAPTLTASTYGKMSFEVKERLAKQYGANPPQLNKLRMLDLIFYNPSDNPMSQPSKQPEQTPKSVNNQDVRKSEACGAESTTVSESDSDPDEPEEQKDVNVSSDSRLATSEPAVPVPQVRIGDEGQIILAPESLVMKKKEAEVMNSPVVEEYSFSDSNRKKPSLDRTTWSFEETLQFYKALHSLGTDFSMMNEMFPRRTRANLKSKFKREERKNPALIDKVLAAQGLTLNFSDVEKDLTTDKTLRRLGLDCTRTPVCRNNTKKVWQRKAASTGLNPASGENLSESSCLSNSATDMKNSKSEGNEDQSTSSKTSDEKPKVTSRGTSEKDEDGIFKRPSNIRPPRKRKTVKSIPSLPDSKRKKAESASVKGSKETTDKGEDGVFKKPRVPKKRKVSQPCSSKRPISPEPVQHILSISLNDEDQESDDTDDSASLDGADDECLIIKTDIKGDNYSYSRSVRVHIADPEVPIEWNETIEHDRPQTPMSDSMSETDMEMGSDSEAGEEVEVVSIDVNEIASYLEKTGGVVIESSQENDANAEDLPAPEETITRGPSPVNQLLISPH